MKKAEIIAPATNGFDKLDLLIMRELEIDARQSDSSIAKRLGTSSATVGRRLRKLLEEGTIEFATVTDYRALGYTLFITFALTVQPGTAYETADQLAQRSQIIRHIWVSTGRYDILAVAFFRDSDDLLRFLDHELSILPNVKSFEIITALKALKASWGYLAPPEKIDSQWVSTPRHSLNLKASDLSLIKEIERDPRQTAAELSKQLGVSIATVRRKLRTFSDLDIIKVITIQNPSALGYTIHATLLIEAVSSNISSVANQLAACKEVKHIAIMSGVFTIMAWAAFESADCLQRFA